MIVVKYPGPYLSSIILLLETCKMFNHRNHYTTRHSRRRYIESIFHTEHTLLHLVMLKTLPSGISKISPITLITFPIMLNHAELISYALTHIKQLYHVTYIYVYIAFIAPLTMYTNCMALHKTKLHFIEVYFRPELDIKLVEDLFCILLSIHDFIQDTIISILLLTLT